MIEGRKAIQSVGGVGHRPCLQVFLKNPVAVVDGLQNTGSIGFNFHPVVFIPPQPCATDPT